MTSITLGKKVTVTTMLRGLLSAHGTQYVAGIIAAERGNFIGIVDGVADHAQIMAVYGAKWGMSETKTLPMRCAMPSIMVQRSLT
ncbi:hypothetical protein OK016_18025 [Vibrio chagasii]|nr:hypothetical protein [Vibrio chagasii]